MDNQNLTISFANIDSNDINIVGGKGANLGEMTQAGFPVPGGFCVTTMAYDIFIQSFAEMDQYYQQLENLGDDIQATRVLGGKIRHSLANLEMPQDIKDAIIDSLKSTGEDFAYAIRSSATAEDLPDNSFAGQQDTYLNIYGQENIITAIKNCWASLFTDRAILYRNKNSFKHQDVKLSVVVQKMIPSEVSGIMFSADPLTGNRNIITIDASFGLGEALVSGLVNPDQYKIDKTTHTIIDKNIAQKLLAIYSNKEIGTYEEKLPEKTQYKKALSDEQILSLAKLAQKIESHYNKPQDMEWGIFENKIYLLQTRPITSLYPIDNLIRDDFLHVYFSVGHQQMMTDPISVMGISTVKNILPFGKTNNQAESSVFFASGGRLFGDITKLLVNPIASKVLMKISAQFNILAPKMLEQLKHKPNLDKSSKKLFSFGVLKNLLAIFYKVIASLLWRNLDNLVITVNDKIDNHVETIKKDLAKAQDFNEKVKISKQSLGSLFGVVIFWLPNYISSVIADNIITKLVKGKVSAEDLANYKLGFEGNVVNQMNLELGKLAEIVRNTKQLREFLENNYIGNKDLTINDARSIEDAKEFFVNWDNFINKYGARGSSEFDIARDRWYEDPSSLVNVIINYLQKAPDQYLKTHNDLIKKQQLAISNIISAANTGVTKLIKAKIVKRMLYVVEKASVLREHHKFLAVKMMQLIKQEQQTMAKELVDKNLLEAEKDIWYLTWYELSNLDKYADSFKEKVKKEKQNYKRYQNLTPPLIITSQGETPVVKHYLEDVPEGAFVGQAVSSGVVEAVARVIKDPLKEDLKKGEILVAPFTDPGWTPLFINAAGLITEVGGSLTHGSVVAREYNIPAVVGVAGITKQIKTGQKIKLDGNSGIIEILN